MWDGAIFFYLLLAFVPSKDLPFFFCILYTSHLYLRPTKAGDSRGKAGLKCQQESEIFTYFILYSENQCISKLDKIGIFIDMKFH